MLRVVDDVRYQKRRRDAERPKHARAMALDLPPADEAESRRVQDRRETVQRRVQGRKVRDGHDAASKRDGEK